MPSICSDHAQTVKSITSFRNVSLMELKAYISDLKKKSCECDPIPTSLLMEFTHLLYPFILQLVNSSFTDGVFPQQLKHAIITPIIKNHSADANDLKNYRPVSSLPFISKVLEKSIYSQLNDHIEKTNFMQSFNPPTEVITPVKLVLLKCITILKSV